MKKITRISYNSSEWQRPTGDARKYEVAGTYNHKHGFGHEDWLFRTEWMIDGWRYAFIQGVNTSHAKLVKAGRPIDLTLFTIEPDKRRRFVAAIRGVECLDDQQAEDALEVFKEQGWYKTMQTEIRAVGGIAAALGNVEWAKHILDVRFRQENVQRFAPDSYAASQDPIIRLTRYLLYDGKRILPSNGVAKRSRNSGSTSLPKAQPFLRRGSATVECTPEHARMQAKLMKELKSEYPRAHIVRERDYIDVSVRTVNELILFEIKSDLDPTTVIRQALGQILEYAYHPTRTHSLPLQLVIVGRHPLSPMDEIYFYHLKTEFSLPLAYRVVKL